MKIGITTDLEGTFVKLKRDYVSAVAAAGGVPLLLAPWGRNTAGDHGDGHETEDLDEVMETIDGLLIPGGDDVPPEYYGEDFAVPRTCIAEAHRERVGFESALVAEALRRGKPVLGVCYGMQLLNVVLGGALYQDLAVQRVTTVDHRRNAHRIAISPALAASLGLDGLSFGVNSSHHQAVKRLGGGLEVCALSEDGVVEGIRHMSHPFAVGVQWHPERWGDTPLSRSLFGAFIEAARAGRMKTGRGLSPGATYAI